MVVIASVVAMEIWLGAILTIGPGQGVDEHRIHAAGVGVRTVLDVRIVNRDTLVSLDDLLDQP